MAIPDRFLFGSLLLCSVLAFAVPARGIEGRKMENSCVHCHSRLPPSSFVGVKSHSWQGSVHQAHGVTCDECHGGDPQAEEKKAAHAGVLGSSNPQSLIYYKKIPSTCGKCHGAEFFKFTQSRHYQMLESKGKGPDCVTCHGSMVTKVLAPGTIAAVCERCHNERMNILPYIPQKAKAVLLLLRESKALLDANAKLYHPAEGTIEASSLNDAGNALHSARLDWHRFDLDAITNNLESFYEAIQGVSPERTQQK